MWHLVAGIAAMIRIDAMWLATAPMDMRAGADKLLARVVAVFGSAQAHHGYLFANARANRMKLLVHDGFGVWCATRRLHQGGFTWPGRHDAISADATAKAAPGRKAQRTPGALPCSAKANKAVSTANTVAWANLSHGAAKRPTATGCAPPTNKPATIKITAAAHNRRPGRELSSFLIIYEPNKLLAFVSIA